MDMSDNEPDMDPVVSPAPAMMNKSEKPYGDKQHNLTRPEDGNSRSEKTAEALRILGAGTPYGNNQ